MYFDRNLSADIYGTDNVHSLLRQNELYPKRYMAAVRNIEVPEVEPYSLNDLRNGIAPRVDLSDLKHNLNELKLSEHGQNFAKFAAWLHLEHSDGWDDIIDSVDTEKIAQKYNQIRTSTLDDVNGVELPDNLQQEILDRLGDYVSEEQAQQFEGLLQDALSDLQEDANGSNTISAEQVKDKVTEVIEGLQGQLNDEIMSNPDVYYEIYRDTLRHLQGLYKSYQTASDTPSLHANIEISRLGEDLDWRLGANWNQLASGSIETVAEERMGIYSVLDWRFAQDWAYQNIASVDYYKNHLGLEGTDSASALFYNRISYDVNDMVTAYVAAGASAEPIDGAFITAEIGARSCWSFMQNKSQICAQGAYEQNKSIDVAGKEFMGIEDAEGSGTKLSLTYQMTF
jgi:hypothetical protein